MLDHYLDKTIEAILIGYSCHLTIRGVLKPHATLSAWYHLSPLGLNAYLTFEVTGYSTEDSTLDGVPKLIIMMARN